MRVLNELLGAAVRTGLLPGPPAQHAGRRLADFQQLCSDPWTAEDGALLLAVAEAVVFPALEGAPDPAAPEAKR